MSAQMFLDTMYGDLKAASRASSRAPTPMVVRVPSSTTQCTSSQSLHETQHPSSQSLYPLMRSLESESPKSIRVVTTSQAEASSQSENKIQLQPQYQATGISILGHLLNGSVDGISTVSGYTYQLPSYMQTTFANAIKHIAKSALKTQGENYAPPPTPRRHLLQRPSALPLLPDIGNVAVEVDAGAEYALLISMYEVYNDRIFDLLTPAIPGKSTKDFRRRPLLFKPTEQSPDRKVVAGLRKIICGTMKEALMVLEAGLHERRVAGTGSNSVSSRSHGFFCVEVKKRRRSRMPSPWGGSALTIVDLAGSERARDAKTQGATLQEAGKINESLMYLGQCLQMQSDLGSSTKVTSPLPTHEYETLENLANLNTEQPNLVPFRQCKLTELLFSNSFPSTSHQSIPPTPSSHHHIYLPHHSSVSQNRNPQKAIMIVTADPVGDFNATSQILRYSALAREITVPRIPSVTSTILAQSTASHYFSPRGGRMSPTDTERETMEIAALEIARMSEEIDGLRLELAAEQERRLEVEAHLESLSNRSLEMEIEIREECYLEMETRMESEMKRWKASWEMEAEKGEVHLDRKLDLYTRSLDAGFDEGEDKENSHSGARDELLAENEKLTGEVEQLRRQVHGRSPSKLSRMPLRESRVGRESGKMDRANKVGRAMASMKIDIDESVAVKGAGPVKKIRHLTARKWDLMDDSEML